MTDQIAARTPMTPAEMDVLIDQHISAEMAGDVAGAVAMYTDDVVHDTVGLPDGPYRGPEGAAAFYDMLVANARTEEMAVVEARYGADFCVIEHRATVTVHGEFLGVPGHGKRITFRMLHLWDFVDGRISRENIWLDGGSIVAQLMA